MRNVFRSIPIRILFCVSSITIAFFAFRFGDWSRPNPDSREVELSQNTKLSDRAVETPQASSLKNPSGARVGLDERAQEQAISTTVSANKADGSTRLTRSNFEGFVSRCFNGEACELDEDPRELYESFKASGNREANDRLISFLRSRLFDADFKHRHMDVVLDMIHDFYGSNERQFQEAAFYSYAGDLEKSLDLYLDLEKKSALNPNLRDAPKLNIANVFYDLDRLHEALSYYEAAREQYMSGQQQVGIPSQNEMLRYIEERISVVRTKLAR